MFLLKIDKEQQEQQVSWQTFFFTILKFSYIKSTCSGSALV